MSSVSGSFSFPNLSDSWEPTEATPMTLSYSYGKVPIVDLGVVDADL